MSSFAKTLAVVLAGLLTTVIVVAADKAGDAKAKKSESKESADKKGKKDKDKAKEKPQAGEKDKPKAPEDPDAAPRPFEVPMPNGRDAKGIRLPVRNAEGKLTLRYTIGMAKKVDDTHLEMSELQVETFDENGEHEMSMDLPTSVMDLSTWVITSYKPVKIKRDDFELTGETMIFNTRTKQGGLGGNVKMVIYNLFDDADAKPDDKKSNAANPAAAASPAPEPNTK
jgi:hypothetical protein